MTAAAMATTATVEAARITRHSFPGDPLVKTTSTELYHSRERPQRSGVSASCVFACA
jgi:hypothetical protein